MSNLKAGHKTQANQAHQQYQKLIGQKQPCLFISPIGPILFLRPMELKPHFVI